MKHIKGRGSIKIKGPFSIAHQWLNLNITSKFNIAFGGFFSLLLMVSVTSYFSLSRVRHQTEISIATSIEIQQHILEMNDALHTARVYERDFFLRYYEIDFTTVQQDYAAGAISKIVDVIQLSQSLKLLLNSSNFQTSLRDQNIDLARYFLFAERYRDTFLDAIELVTQLVGEDDGLWGKLEQTAVELEDELSLLEQPTLTETYYKMRTFEKDFRITHKRSDVQSVRNILFSLYQLIDEEYSINPLNHSKIYILLEKYERTIQEIELLDSEIGKQFRDFTLQASEIDSVSEELIRLASEDVDQAQANIQNTYQWANISLGITIITGLILASAIARLLIHSITKRIIQLHQTVEALQAGHLNARTTMDIGKTKTDELGQLGRSFNEMAHQLQTSFNALETANDQLEERVRDRTSALSNVIKQLKETQIQLVQTEKMSSLGQMVAGVAHEINNPVSFIYGNINPARQYIDDLTDLIHLYQIGYSNSHPIIQAKIEEIDLDFIQKDLWNLIDSMEEGAIRIREIVKSLRTFSRLDEADFKDADLHSGIDSTLMILQNRLRYLDNNNGINIIKEYGNLPTVSCYPGQLNQVFMNILVNAIDALEDCSSQVSLISKLSSQQWKGNQNGPYNGSEKPHSTEPHLPEQLEHQIKVQTQTTDNNWVWVRITDNGPGMPEEVRQKLFDPFFTTKGVGKGTGLGLSISYQIIVERHHGRLWCESQVGQGTTFHIQIPICQTQPSG